MAVRDKVGVGSIDAREASADPDIFESRKIRPIVWFAGLGTVYVGLVVFVWAKWIFFSPDFRPVDHGPTKPPGWMLVSIRTQEIVGVAVFSFMVYWVVIRPWRREGHLTWGGMFFLSGMSMFLLLDMALNWVGYVFLYNSYVVNRGAWYSSFPLWFLPNGGRIADAVVWGFTWYAPGIYGACYVFNIVMTRAKRRWPRLGLVGIFGIAFTLAFTVDVVFELFYLRAGLYSYVGAVQGWWTIFGGHYYQFPLYEGVMWGAAWGALACVRFYRNDRGESIFERGVQQLRMSDRRKQGLRLLALIGGVNLVFLIYNAGMWAIHLPHPSPWPADVQNRSYFTNMICGPGTDRACPGGDVPLSRRGGIYLDPDGRLVVPPGAQLPHQEPENKG